MKERAINFGPQASLLGVLTEPTTPRPDAPAVLMINAGLIHRVGPNRLYVHIARRLAEAGFASLRFDLSGMGDSLMRGGDATIAGRAQEDIRLAMAEVGETLACHRFVVMGLCSGAIAAHTAAVSDERVAGCIQLDGYVYPTRGYYLRHYGSRALRIGPWIRSLRRLMNRAAGPSRAAESSGGPENRAPFAGDFAPRHVFARELAALVERRTELLFVITGGGPLPVNYARQLHDSVPDVDLDGAATVRYIPEADHTFTHAGHRNWLLEAITEWMEARFPTG